MTQVNNPMDKVRAPQRALYIAAKRNPTSWESRDSFGVNTIGEPCDRKGHARFDGEALASGGLYGWAIYSPGGNDGISSPTSEPCWASALPYTQPGLTVPSATRLRTLGLVWSKVVQF